MNRYTIALFFGGCCLTFVGVKLLTSRRARDDKREAMLPGPKRGPVDPDELEPPDSPELPPLDRSFFQPPSRSFSHMSEFERDRTSLPPLTLLNTPMTLSGDVLRRTFSTRLAEMSERATQAERGSVQPGGYRPPSRGTL